MRFRFIVLVCFFLALMVGIFDRFRFGFSGITWQQIIAIVLLFGIIAWRLSVYGGGLKKRYQEKKETENKNVVN